MDDVEDVLKLGLPLDQYETLSGFFIGELGRFPDQNEQPHFTFNGVQFTAIELDELRVSKIQVKVLEIVENSQ